jgi:hypothetical protein
LIERCDFASAHQRDGAAQAFCDFLQQRIDLGVSGGL